MADDKNIQHHVHVLAFEWNAGNVALFFMNFKNMKSNRNYTILMILIWCIQCISNENITQHG